MSVTPLRRRMTPEESRSAALSAARELLVEVGPQAVTLKAVGARIGRTHANLLHHFGSAEGLQKALIEDLAARIGGTIKAAVLRSREAEDPAATPPTGVEEPFKAAKERVIAEFERAYLERLMTWAGGNVSRAARHAKIDRMHLHRLLQRHAVRRESQTDE